MTLKNSLKLLPRLLGSINLPVLSIFCHLDKGFHAIYMPFPPPIFFIALPPNGHFFPPRGFSVPTRPPNREWPPPSLLFQEAARLWMRLPWQRSPSIPRLQATVARAAECCSGGISASLAPALLPSPPAQPWEPARWGMRKLRPGQPHGSVAAPSWRSGGGCCSGCFSSSCLCSVSLARLGRGRPPRGGGAGAAVAWVGEVSRGGGGRGDREVWRRGEQLF